MRVKMKAEIYYLTKEMRDNPATWHSADETINAITYNKKKCYAKVHVLENVTDKKDPAELAEIIWALMNGMAGGEDPSGLPNPLGNPEGQQKIRNLGVGHTSMSIGDFIVFPEKTGAFGEGMVLVADTLGFKESPLLLESIR